MSKICSRCHIEKEFSEFPKNGEKLHSWCKQCHREVVREKYKANSEWINSLKIKCSQCGYDKNKSALEFHHLYGKDDTIHNMSKNAITNKNRILKEIEKCIVLCANCHRELHNPHLNKNIDP